jgi:predicted dithiol-disulfide oxidoreductase (DUF899 family)
MMYADDWPKACSLCCFFVDQLEGALPHLRSRVSVAVVANAPYAKLAMLKESKQWAIPILCGTGTGFGEAMGVSFPPAAKQGALSGSGSGGNSYNFTAQWNYGNEAPGVSVFHKRPSDGALFHTYSTFGAGLGEVSLV